MKKITGLLAGLFVFAAVNVWALSIGSITVTGTNSDSGAVTVNANVSGVTGVGFAMLQVTSADGLSRRYFQPTQISGSSWSSSDWSPYFTGTFIISITAYDYAGQTTGSATVTVSRAVSGTVNGVQYGELPYNATGTWNNIDLSLVKLHDVGLMTDLSGVQSLGCNLLNANPTITQNMTEEQMDIAYADTVGYKPAGTPYRFDVSLHARPRGFMCMGEVKRWIWAPYDTNSPDGSGILTVDITSCSPWRSSYSNVLHSHVGFSPLFAPTNFTQMPAGMIQCTSAHYMDVGPTNTGTQAEARIGLRVNGHTGTNSYLKTFISDIFLQQQFGLTNVYDATNIMAGFVQHFNTNGAPIDDVTQVTATFTRIVGGTGTNLIYDYNFDGIGDAGYEARLNFEFHSAVAAQFGIMSTNVTESAYSTLVGDFDGDRLADPALFNTNGTWKIKLSGSGYALVTLAGFLGDSGAMPVEADFDGDAKADPAVYYASLELWAVKLSSINYLAPTVITGFGGIGWEALAGDFDGDRLADPALYQASTGDWKVKLSTAGYASITKPNLLGLTGDEWAPIAADFDGDGKVDPAIYNAATGSWIVMLSRSDYMLAVIEAGFLGDTDYIGMGADFDGDRLADPTVAETSTGNWKIRLSGSGYGLLDLPGFLGQ